MQDENAKISMRGEICGRYKSVECLEYLDNNRLIMGSLYRTAKIWDVLLLEEVHCIQLEGGGTLSCFSCCPHLNRFACLLSASSVEIFELDSYAHVASISVNGDEKVLYSPTEAVILL